MHGHSKTPLVIGFDITNWPLDVKSVSCTTCARTKVDPPFGGCSVEVALFPQMLLFGFILRKACLVPLICLTPGKLWCLRPERKHGNHSIGHLPNMTSNVNSKVPSRLNERTW